ncbi:hypothetical protein CBI38_32995 (plasmid) [Rhodococcus oxybenzonivorans]|uniref:Thiolase C-terminal domain-containing protein n=1 Tax=Rhodococcus oxybenzonivorans TaxID=1990687 RepID=A0A2S2C5Y3_9NOCA|nr:thiolase family protein [Rhodococcus oxybenzonivorans]AWK76280.1 hypothetical protein CBI38_32995 [Rhodococcus oxybenzonivorans]
MAEELAVIVGTGTTRFARVRPDTDQLGLMVEASLAAIEDAGLKTTDIDGIVAYGGNIDDRLEIQMSEHLGLYETPVFASIDAGGGGSGHHVEFARHALRRGRARHILCVTGFQESSWGKPTKHASGSVEDLAGASGTSGPTAHFVNTERPYGGTLPAHYGAIAQRHMHQYGTTPEHLAAVAHAIRANGSLNPEAINRNAPSIEEILASPMISTPLTKLMCCLINDGAAAFVMTTADRARDLPHKPVYVLGTGAGALGYSPNILAKGSNGYDLVNTMGKVAADEAFKEGGLKPSDVDVVTLCDNFAITPLLALEDYGFCAKGEGGDFVGDGSRLKIGGELPVNPHGGWLSCSHAGIFHTNLVEAVRQLQGVCGERQVDGAEVALHGANGGSLNTHSCVLLANGAS